MILLCFYQNREGSIGDDKSERSSVVGGVAEKSQRMQLLHEINISSILVCDVNYLKFPIVISI